MFILIFAGQIKKNLRGNGVYYIIYFGKGLRVLVLYFFQIDNLSFISVISTIQTKT
jgi:hypothetical protein